MLTCGDFWCLAFPPIGYASVNEFYYFVRIMVVCLLLGIYIGSFYLAIHPTLSE